MAATPVSSVKEPHADYYRRCADDVIRYGGIYFFFPIGKNIIFPIQMFFCVFFSFFFSNVILILSQCYFVNYINKLRSCHNYL